MFDEDDDDYEESYETKPNGDLLVTIKLDNYSLSSLPSIVANRLLADKKIDAEGISKRIDEAVKTLITDTVKTSISDRVNALLDEAIAKELKITNSWGEPNGKTTTMREHIAAQFSKSLNDKVNNDGRLDTSYGKQTRLAWLIHKEGVEPVIAAAKGEITKVRQEAEKQVSAAIGNFIAKNLVAPVTATSLPSR